MLDVIWGQRILINVELLRDWKYIINNHSFILFQVVKGMLFDLKVVRVCRIIPVSLNFTHILLKISVT